MSVFIKIKIKTKTKMKNQKNKNKNNDLQSIFRPFNGSVDDLLNHVDKFDPTVVENVVVNQTEEVLLDDTTAIAMIQSELNCDEEMAKDIFNNIKLEEVTRVIDNLVDEGLVEVVDYVDGEPRFSLTENGKLMSEKLKKSH